MAAASQPLSVMIVDEDPDVLSFFARVLDANGVRALLARTPAEALDIAKRGYVPIDLIVTDVALTPSAGSAPESFTSGRDLVDAVRRLRPGVRSLLMSAYVETGVIRIQMVDHEFKTTSKNADDAGLIESIRRSATAPLVYHAGTSALD